MFKPVAAAVLCLSPLLAHADVFLDFENFNVGDSIGAYYQQQYGITFSGGRIAEVNGSKVLSGHFSVSFAPPKDLDRITLMGSQWMDGNTWVTYASGFTEPYYRDATLDPHCRGTDCRVGNYDYIYIAPDQLFSYRFLNTPVDPITSISFITDLADNLRFVSPSWTDKEPMPASQVPVPGTLALLGIGGLFLRRKSQKMGHLVE